MSRFQVEPVSLWVGGPGAAQAPLLLARQLSLQAFGNVAHDVALQLRDVGRLTHIMRAPKFAPVGGADEVSLDAYFFAALSNLSDQDRADFKLLPDFLRVFLFTLEPEHTATRQHFEIGQLG